MDECSMHVREAFRDLAKLVNLKMFVDFPNDPSACREHDPQKPPARSYNLCDIPVESHSYNKAESK